MNAKALYPGTFDPVTYGHIDIIERSSCIYAAVLIGVAESADKKPLFNVKDRVAMLKKATGRLKNVKVEAFKGLVTDFAKEKKINIIIRGLRMISDFEYELQMALTNRKLCKNIETIFMMTHEDYSYFSSKLIKEAVRLGANAENFVPAFVAERLRKKLGK